MTVIVIHADVVEFHLYLSEQWNNAYSNPTSSQSRSTLGVITTMVSLSNYNVHHEPVMNLECA